VAGHELLLNIAGGVALLLWATRMVRTGVMRAYGSDLRHFLGRSTRNRFSACAMGLAVASVLQSSTATALLAVSFAGRGLVAIGAGLAIMLGADVGSTLVVQVLSFDISWLSPVLLLVGVVSFLAGPSAQWRHVGRMLVGLGLMLLALNLVVGASQPLRDSTTLQYVLRPLASDPILALLLAAVITWVAHSSVAIVLLIMSLTVVGVVPLTLGFALVLGANVGSGIIPLALSATGGAMARRIPLGNLAFRALGAIMMLPLIDLAAPYVAMLGSAPGRQIANFHTAFNLALVLVFLPLTTWAGALLVKFLPDTGGQGSEIKPRYLDQAVIDTPSVAIACATREVLRMADTVENMLRDVIEVFRRDDAKLLESVSAMDDQVDRLHESIKLYLTQVSRNALSDEDSRRCVDLISFTTNLEHIGDIIDKNLLDLAGKKMRNKLTFSEQGWQELTAMHARAVHQMQLALSVFVSHDIETARQLLKEKEKFRTLEMEGGQKHLARLRSGQIESIETSALHLDILRDLKRINSHLTSVAYPILDASGELRQSRLKAAPEEEPKHPRAKPDQATVGS
jgi:phosphate:Na+ symporter